MAETIEAEYEQYVSRLSRELMLIKFATNFNLTSIASNTTLVTRFGHFFPLRTRSMVPWSGVAIFLEDYEPRSSYPLE